MADIYVRSNTGANGTVTDPAVYQNAISTYLAPYANNPTVQKQIEIYTNSAKALSAKSTDQNITLVKFRQQLDAAMFSNNDGARNPYALAQNTSQLLGSALFMLDKNIANLTAQNKSTDALVSYRATLAQASQQENDLVNGLKNGTVNPQQDGYGYFVKTNPVDGSLLGVALLPTDPGVLNKLTDTTANMSRLSSNATVGTGTATSTLPVYMTSTTDSTGAKNAVLGSGANQKTWSGTATGALDSADGTDTLDLSTPQATAAYPFQSNTTLKPGQVGQVMSGISATGQPQYTTYMRGKDGTLNVISDPNVVASLQNDPVLGQAAKNPLSLTPGDVQSMGTSTPMGMKQLQGLESASPVGVAAPVTPAAPAAPAQPGFFAGAEKAIGGVASSIGSAVSGFFNNKNRPSTPVAPTESVNGAPSAPDIVNKGASFFNSAPSTLPPTQ